jgi:hypothetical protein
MTPGCDGGLPQQLDSEEGWRCVYLALATHSAVAAEVKGRRLFAASLKASFHQDRSSGWAGSLPESGRSAIASEADVPVAAYSRTMW